MQVDLPGNSAEGDPISDDVAKTALIHSFITADTLKNAVIQSLITQQAANIAQNVLSDSTTAQDIRTNLGSNASVKRSDVLQQSVIDTITNNDQTQTDLTTIASNDQHVSDAVAPLVTNQVADTVAAALANNQDPAQALAPVLQSADAAGAAVQNALSGSGAAQAITDHVDESTTATKMPPLLQVLLTDSHGKTLIPKYHFAKGSVDLVIDPLQSFTPGVYTLSVTVTDPLTGNAQSFTQNFDWGVLAMNPDKDSYQQNDTAKIDIGVLNEKGDIVCDADLTLEVTSPSGETQTLSTPAQTQNFLGKLASLFTGDVSADTGSTIIRTGSCGIKRPGFIEPDFTTSLHLSEQGTYQLHLVAT